MAIPEISIDDLAEKRANDAGLRLIDVREVDEYRSGHVPGAELVVLADVADRVEALRGVDPLYVICRSGGRSMSACELLDAHGVAVVNVAGGTMAWAMSGRDIATGDSPEEPEPV